MSDVDATDVVGKNLASLFDVGLDRGTELTRSLELGQVGEEWRAIQRQFCVDLGPLRSLLLVVGDLLPKPKCRNRQESYMVLASC